MVYLHMAGYIVFAAGVAIAVGMIGGILVIDRMIRRFVEGADYLRVERHD